MSDEEGAKRWESLLVTLPPADAAEIRAEAKEKQWPITLVIRERLKDGKRWREAQQKGAPR